MNKEQVVIRFNDVSFRYSEEKVIFDEVNFSIRRNSKITVMGQNGAGKSTLFALLTGKLKPNSGEIHLENNAKVAIAEQMVPKDKLELSILDYFKSAFDYEFHGIEKNIYKVLNEVNLDTPLDKKVKELSGGQKARLLLSYALIQEPDILLLDEPTNNLDEEGIGELTVFLMMYEKTVVVISHDTNFLNSFTDGVLNLDVHTKKIEQFVGDYYDVLDQISRHIEKQRLDNARIQKSIKDRFEKVNKLGGKSVAMRRLARKTRAEIHEDRENLVDARQEDRTINKFLIPHQHIGSSTATITKITRIKDGSPISKDVNIDIFRGDKVIISGPNGIGKTTLLRSFLNGEGIKFSEDLRIGYYSQDFSELNFDQTGFESLKSVMLDFKQQELYQVAAKFLLTGDLLHKKIESLSEGQKGLLSYARFVLQEPGLLIIDEPTNHINFRHLPIIAEALHDYKGAMILISHVPEFVDQIEINHKIDLTQI